MMADAPNKGPSWAGTIFGIVVGVGLSLWMGWGGNSSSQTKEVIKEVPVEVTRTVEVVNNQRIKELELQLQIAQADRASLVKKFDAQSLELKNVQYEAITYRDQRDKALAGQEVKETPVASQEPTTTYYAPRRRGLFRRW